jgi:hypothetical protein
MYNGDAVGLCVFILEEGISFEARSQRSWKNAASQCLCARPSVRVFACHNARTAERILITFVTGEIWKHRRQLSSYSPPWEPEISPAQTFVHTFTCCLKSDNNIGYFASDIQPAVSACRAELAKYLLERKMFQTKVIDRHERNMLFPVHFSRKSYG